MNTFEIIQKPLVTERSTILREKLGQYIFRVHPSASKLEIKEAVEKFFDVDVKKVRTALVPGKLRRLALGRPQGRRPEWKKAIITLAEGQKINLEPEVK